MPAISWRLTVHLAVGLAQLEEVRRAWREPLEERRSDAALSGRLDVRRHRVAVHGNALRLGTYTPRPLGLPLVERVAGLEGWGVQGDVGVDVDGSGEVGGRRQEEVARARRLRCVAGIRQPTSAEPRREENRP